MKESNKGESTRWLEQAVYDLKTVRWVLKGNLFAPACFWAQQAAEKAGKAYLYFRGERVGIGHSVAELLQKCNHHDKDFKPMTAIGAFLDRSTFLRDIPMVSPAGFRHMSTEGKTRLKRFRRPRKFLT